MDKNSKLVNSLDANKSERRIMTFLSGIFLFKFRFPVVSEKDKNGLLHIISSIQVSCQASEDVKNRRQQGFVDFLDVYLNSYAVAAKRSTYFFFLKKKKK